MPNRPRTETGVFAPPSEHRAGTWTDPETDYATDNCHFEFDRTVRPPPTAIDRGLQTLHCKRSVRGGGSEMFKDLKPGYPDESPESQTP
jgi:hypothetical protein